MFTKLWHIWMHLTIVCFCCSGEHHLGYNKHELSRVSYYHLIHPDSVREVAAKHRLSEWTFYIFKPLLICDWSYCPLSECCSNAVGEWPSLHSAHKTSKKERILDVSSNSHLQTGKFLLLESVPWYPSLFAGGCTRCCRWRTRGRRRAPRWSSAPVRFSAWERPLSCAPTLGCTTTTWFRAACSTVLPMGLTRRLPSHPSTTLMLLPSTMSQVLPAYTQPTCRLPSFLIHTTPILHLFNIITPFHQTPHTPHTFLIPKTPCRCPWTSARVPLAGRAMEARENRRRPNIGITCDLKTCLQNLPAGNLIPQGLLLSDWKVEVVTQELFSHGMGVNITHQHGHMRL